MATREMLDKLEELASVRAYDSAKASGEEVIPFEQALQEISEPEVCATERTEEGLQRPRDSRDSKD